MDRLEFDQVCCELCHQLPYKFQMSLTVEIGSSAHHITFVCVIINNFCKSKNSLNRSIVKSHYYKYLLSS